MRWSNLGQAIVVYIALTSEKSMALTGRCFSVASLVFLLQTFRSLAGFRGIYPPVTELSKFKSVQTSSTCGLNNVPMRYCVSSTSNQTVSTCTQFTCLFDCCTNCGKTKPPDLSMLTGTQTQITPSSDLRPGSVAGSRSSSFAPGSSVSYGSLAASNVPKSGLSVAAWVKQQTGTTGYMFCILLYFELCHCIACCTSAGSRCGRNRMEASQE